MLHKIFNRFDSAKSIPEKLIYGSTSLAKIYTTTRGVMYIAYMARNYQDPEPYAYDYCFYQAFTMGLALITLSGIDELVHQLSLRRNKKILNQFFPVSLYSLK